MARGTLGGKDNDAFTDIFGGVLDAMTGLFGGRPSRPGSLASKEKSVAPSLPDPVTAPQAESLADDRMVNDRVDQGANLNSKAMSDTAPAPQTEDNPGADPGADPAADPTGSGVASGAGEHGVGGSTSTGETGPTGGGSGASGYKSGGMVRETGKATVHAGEYVLTKEEVAILGVARLDQARAMVRSNAPLQAKQHALGELFGGIRPKPIQPMFGAGTNR